MEINKKGKHTACAKWVKELPPHKKVQAQRWMLANPEVAEDGLQKLFKTHHKKQKRHRHKSLVPEITARPKRAARPKQVARAAREGVHGCAGKCETVPG